MIRPHGGELVNRNLKKNNIEVKEYPRFEISTNISEDILNIANGIFSPLKGFL